jgi:type II secretory pathway pseudopilin PulG
MKAPHGKTTRPHSRDFFSRHRIARHRHRRAFTRIELAAVLAVVGMLTVVAMTALAGNRAESDRAVCFNNLRQIGRALISWSGEHGGQVPWRVSTSDGGTLPPTGTKPGNAWFEFTYLSNELVSPKILACPADGPPMLANTWSNFTSVAFRGNAVSYNIGLDAFPEWPGGVVFLDRNVRFDSGPFTCSAQVNNTVTANVRVPFSSVAWTNSVHGASGGHAVAVDGSVQFTTSAELRAAIGRSDDNGSTHYVRAR